MAEVVKMGGGSPGPQGPSGGQKPPSGGEGIMANKPVVIAILCSVIAICVAVAVWFAVPHQTAGVGAGSGTERETGAEAAKLEELQKQQNESTMSSTEKEGTISR